MKTTCTPSDQIAELLVHLGRSARCEDAGSCLTAAQWTCLRFFARATRNSCTPSAFARFQATTRGTASQIIKTLEGKGLIARRRSETDKRSVLFQVTEAGRAVLSDDPLGELVFAIDRLDPAMREVFLAALSHVAEGLGALRGTSAFGTCADCTHFSEAGCGGYCACAAAALAPTEIGKLCANHNRDAADCAAPQLKRPPQ